MTAQVVRPVGDANRPVWDGSSRGHYEVWYVTLSDPATGYGFWFRYTLEVPKDPAARKVAELWGFAFRPGQPAVGGKVTHDLDWPPRGLMHVGEAVLEDGHAVGSLPHGLAWDLRWDPSPTAMWHIPGRLGQSKLPSTRVVCPSVNATFTGTVTIGGDEVHLQAARGCQTHLWGRQHAARWAWGHGSAFTDEAGARRDDVVLEAVWAVPLLAPGRAAPAGPTFLYAEVAGVPVTCNALAWFPRARSRISGHRWEMHGRTRDARVRAVLEADPGEMAQVTYEDPDGAHSWCANSEIADAALEVEWGDGRLERFESDGLAHVEFGARSPDPDVPILC